MRTRVVPLIVGLLLLPLTQSASGQIQFLQDLRNGEPVKIAAVGTSLTVGFQPGSASWVEQLGVWLEQEAQDPAG